MLKRELTPHNWSDAHKALLARAEKTGDKSLARAVRLLIEQNLELYRENARLRASLPVGGLIDPDLNRLAAIARRLARHLDRVTEALPDEKRFKTMRLQTVQFTTKLDNFLHHRKLPPINPKQGAK